MMAKSRASAVARISWRLFATALAAAVSLSLCACGGYGEDAAQPDAASPSTIEDANRDAAPAEPADIPEFSGQPSIDLDSGVPSFTDEEVAYARGNPGFEEYGQRDALGRCTSAWACLGPETMPAEGAERGGIGMARPAGWQTVRYDFVDGGYLYNRCHLIAWCLSDENANLDNLITGTRYMNVQGMLPYETATARYIEGTGNHVLYRVTPVCDGDELVARWVVMEALSIEDGGAGLSFRVWCSNVQPGVEIDYSDGSSCAAAEMAGQEASGADDSRAYVVNVSSRKFHDPSCSAVEKISPANRSDVSASRAELLDEGYDPCGLCKP